MEEVGKLAERREEKKTLYGMRLAKKGRLVKVLADG